MVIKFWGIVLHIVNQLKVQKFWNYDAYLSKEDTFLKILFHSFTIESGSKTRNNWINKCKRLSCANNFYYRAYPQGNFIKRWWGKYMLCITWLDLYLPDRWTGVPEVRSGHSLEAIFQKWSWFWQYLTVRELDAQRIT